MSTRQELASELAKAIVQGRSSTILDILRSRWPEEIAKRQFPTGGEILSDVAKRTSQLLQDTAPITNRNIPREYRNIGVSIVPGVDVRNLKPGTFQNLTPKQEAAMVDNIVAYAQLGDPNFYWDLNRLQAAAAAGIDPRLTAYTFAPFSASQGLDRNSWLWRMFMQYPEIYPGAFGGDNMATGRAYKSAIKQLIDTLPRPELLREPGSPIIKLGSFGENIADPAGSRRATIDIHATRNPVGIYLPDEFMPQVTSKVKASGSQTGAYRPLENLFFQAAERTGMRPHEVQSAAWDTARRINQQDTTGMLSDEFFSPIDVSPVFDLTPALRGQLFQILSTLGQQEPRLGRFF